MKNTSFIFYESFKRQLDELDNATQIRFYQAITMYGIDGVEPDFSGIEKALWLQFKFVLDETASRRIQNIENGKKGGRPAKYASKEKPSTENQDNSNTSTESDTDIDDKTDTGNCTFGLNKKTEENPTKPTHNLNVNENVNVNVNGNVNEECPETADEDAHPAEKSVPDFPSSSPPRQNNANSGKENAAASTQSDNSGKTENITEFRVAGEPMRLAELLRDLHQKEDPRYRPTPMYIKKWAEDIEKINRIDKRSYEEIERVIRWVKTSGNFWFSNIMSGITLRKQFSRLFLGMTQRQTPHSTGRGNAIERSEVDKIVIEAAEIPF